MKVLHRVLAARLPGDFHQDRRNIATIRQRARTTDLCMQKRTTTPTQFLTFVCLLLAPGAWAEPFIAPGDMALRHDIQRLADHGVLSGPVTTWPLSWGPILSDLQIHRPTVE